MKYKHIVFDVDGTLIDSEYSILAALVDTLKEINGKDYTIDELRYVLGIPGAETLKLFEVKDIENALSLWLKNMDKYKDTIKIFDGVIEVLDLLNSKGYKLGIVTSKLREEFDHDFNRFDIKKYFSTIVCADDTTLHKPYPEPLLKYMELNDIKNKDLIYIGDTGYDYECAKGANVDFALALWTENSHDELDAEIKLYKPMDIFKYV
ncbi:MAG: HAD family hydrolase [Tissierellales bacterium]|jgi:HAD superfamily hydrolase (TIGR01549 family)|nr:HAD family hydrolase [Tissierellales bacterium]